MFGLKIQSTAYKICTPALLQKRIDDILDALVCSSNQHDDCSGNLQLDSVSIESWEGDVWTGGSVSFKTTKLSHLEAPEICAFDEGRPNRSWYNTRLLVFHKRWWWKINQLHDNDYRNDRSACKRIKSLDGVANRCAPAAAEAEYE